MNAIVQPESHALVAPRQQFDLSPQNFEQALTFANYLADSDLVPKDFKGKPGNCLIAMQWGAEIGLKAMQAIQNIAVINGRPALWGDSVIAIVRASPACEYVIEEDNGNAATCRVKRRGEPEQSRTFSMDDAKAAGLAGKQGPWMQYPKRMRQMRARAFALRDVFPDVLKGLPVAEEVMDTPAEKHMGPAEVVQPTTYPQDLFTANLPKWREVIAAGRKTADQIIAMAETKHPLTDAQKAAIKEQTGVQGAGSNSDRGPTLTSDDIKRQMDEATDADSLNEAAALIDAIPDAAVREQLNLHYDARLGEMA